MYVLAFLLRCVLFYSHATIYLWWKDFNYLNSNCFEITVELSCCKYPPVSQLSTEWTNNLPALLAYLEQVSTKANVVNYMNSDPIVMRKSKSGWLLLNEVVCALLCQTQGRWCCAREEKNVNSDSRWIWWHFDHTSLCMQLCSRCILACEVLCTMGSLGLVSRTLSSQVLRRAKGRLVKCCGIATMSLCLCVCVCVCVCVYVLPGLLLYTNHTYTMNYIDHSERTRSRRVHCSIRRFLAIAASWGLFRHCICTGICLCGACDGRGG